MKSTVVDEVLYGSLVTILEEINQDICYIETFYRYRGYVRSTDLLKDVCLVNEWIKIPKNIVNSSYVDILTIPRVQGLCKISLTKGAIIHAVTPANSNGWVLVGLCDGSTGYMKEKFINDYVDCWSRDNEEAFRAAVIKTALSYMGTQYRWGGKTPLGVDCSGLCFMSYLLNGVIIYRDADIVEGFPVHRITRDKMKPGDLLYFPNHMALYIGNDHYVHSTGRNGSDGVVINSLNPKDPDYRADLVNTIIAIGSIF
jgi:hypothetical protein